VGKKKKELRKKKVATVYLLTLNREISAYGAVNQRSYITTLDLPLLSLNVQ